MTGCRKVISKDCTSRNNNGIISALAVNYFFSFILSKLETKLIFSQGKKGLVPHRNIAYIVHHSMTLQPLTELSGNGLIRWASHLVARKASIGSKVCFVFLESP